MGCFCLCWLPFFIIALVVPIHKVVSGKDLEVPDVVRSICLWLGYLNSTINPIIYVIFNRDFRLPFREILLCRCRGMNARLRSQKYALEYGIGTSNASQGGVTGVHTGGTISAPVWGFQFLWTFIPKQ
uniref:SJCHGC07335 protein n=1 Tax=Schistosoma japonicum TaxID=6182 RepID=Q5DCD3_SCHJA|nr:SJCHGC07335 protein [Schistosoma japonicum]